MVTGTSDGAVAVYNLLTGEVLERLSQSSSMVYQVLVLYCTVLYCILWSGAAGGLAGGGDHGGQGDGAQADPAGPEGARLQAHTPPG